MIKTIRFTTNLPYSFIVNINGTRVRLHVRFNETSNSYYFNVDRMVKGEFKNIINSIPLMTGIDLFKRYPEYKLGQMWICPFIEEFYDKTPAAESIQNFMMVMVMDEG